jgi:predicted  nucleic acid-binding Zn-ribbon protein
MAVTGIAQQLYQLQELDLKLESSRHTIGQISSQIGENAEVVNTRKKLAAAQEHLEELKKEQRSVEWEIDDLTNKLAASEEELYSGRTSSPKELTNLQHEIDSLKAKRRQLEERTLDIMDHVEGATKQESVLHKELEGLEKEWQEQQQQLSADLERMKKSTATLEEERETLASGIDPAAIRSYEQLKRLKGTAVARVEQGVCRGCRISLPVTELQRAKSGELVRCSSCGRILFMA